MLSARGPFADGTARASIAERFVPLLLDAAGEDDPAVGKMRQKYRSIGLPTLATLDAKGQERARIMEYVDASALRARLAGGPSPP